MISSTVSAGDTATATQYNNLRQDVYDSYYKIYKNFTAAENLTAGNLVGASGFLNNYVSNAYYPTGKTQTITPSVSAGGACKAVKIAADKFIMIYKDGANTTKVVAATVNPSIITGNPFTFGSAVNITTTNVIGADSSTPLFDVCQLDTDKFAITYAETGATANTRLVIGTISGTTITLGTPVNLDTAANVITGLGICQIATDKAVVGIGKNTGNYRAICFTASGTVATGGTAAALDASFLGARDVLLVKVNTDKFVITSEGGKYQCGSLSGTTITLGSAATGTSGGAYYQSSQLLSPANDVFVHRFGDSGNAAGFYAGTISTTTINLGAKLSIAGSDTVGGLYAKSATEFYTTISNPSIVTTAKKITLSGNTLTDAGNIVMRILVGNAKQSWVNMGTYWFIIAPSTTSFVYYFEGMSNNFIGVAQETVNKGDTVKVLVRGIDANQTGLFAGNHYLVNAGALSLIGDNTAVNTVDDMNIVKSISDTEIII